MAPSRRNFLTMSAATTCVATLSRSTAAFAQPRPTMLTRPIPQSNEPLPVVGLGTWQAFDVGAERAALDQRKEVLQILFDAGGTRDRLLAHVRPRRGGGRHPARRDEGARQRVPRHQGVDLGRGGRHRADEGLAAAKLQAPAHRPDADPQPGRLAHASAHPARLEGAEEVPLHRHHALHRARRSTSWRP